LVNAVPECRPSAQSENDPEDGAETGPVGSKLGQHLQKAVESVGRKVFSCQLVHDQREHRVRMTNKIGADSRHHDFKSLKIKRKQIALTFEETKAYI
jgi:hypothetical protein